jgi:hypothetical protein
MDWSGLSAWTGRDNPFFLGKRGGLRGVGRDAPAGRDVAAAPCGGTTHEAVRRTCHAGVCVFCLEST